jgi:WS/DGAT/MGAT family acyltransferase
MTQRERMSSIDLAWLRMDRPHNLMMIVGVLVLEAPLDIGRLREVVLERFASIPRFRQHPVLEATGGWWATGIPFDIDRHVVRERLPAPASDVQLQRLVGHLASQPLPAGQPLWRFHLVERFGEGCALIVRLHHCYADGIALMRVLLSLADAQPRAARRPVPTHAQADDIPHGPLWQLLEPVSAVVADAARLSGTVLEKYFDMLRHPGQIAQYARAAQRITSDVFELATMPDDAHTRLKGRPSVTKRMAWTGRLPLQDVKAVGQALGCSVNDVLLSCVAGALGHYLRHHAEPMEGVEIRALVPVNLRGERDERSLGNYFGLVPLLLPVAIANPLARLYEVHQRMEALKRSYLAPISLGLLASVGMLPKPVQQEVLDILANKATAVMTNLPGPAGPLWLAGSRIDQIMFWVPQSGNIGMGVSILSFAGSVQFGLITAASLVPDPQRIAERMALELERLVLLALMEPWEERRDPVTVEQEIAAAFGRGPAQARRVAHVRQPGAQRASLRRRQQTQAAASD